MSDRIKKIKVKKADGSMTDYIPIGVDAENVDFDNGYKLDNIVGSINPDESGSIAAQLSKSIKYYDCVADMKADTTLNGGGAARTLGYYEPGDGGGALYEIIDDNDARYNTSTDDGGSVHDLDNNNKALLNIDYNSFINDKVLGISSLNDLEKFNNKKLKIRITEVIPLTKSCTLRNISIDFNHLEWSELPLNIIYYFYLQDNVIVKNGTFKTITPASANVDYCRLFTLQGNNIIIDNINMECIQGVVSTAGCINLQILNCILNNYRTNISLASGIYRDIKIENNQQTKPQIWSQPISGKTIISILNGFYYGQGVPADIITHDILQNSYGENIYIRNNTFTGNNARAIVIQNGHYIYIQNNTITNDPVKGRDELGGNDDCIDVEFCKYGEIANNYIINSGENAIDCLSSSYFNIHDNIGYNIDDCGVDFNNADYYTDSYCASDVTMDDLLCLNNIVSNNIFYSKSVAVMVRQGQNFTINNNICHAMPNSKYTVGVALQSIEPFKTQIGSYKNVIIDNNLYDGVDTQWYSVDTIKASNIICCEANAKTYTYDFDTDVEKAHYIISNQYFKHLKLYLVVDGKDIAIEPISFYDEANSRYKGIKMLMSKENYIYIAFYEYPIPAIYQSSISPWADNKTGTFKIKAW